MKRFLAVAGVLSILSLAAFAQDEGEKPKAKADIEIYVPDGAQPFTVEEGAIVRLRALGTAGAESEAEVVRGPAKLMRTAKVFELQGGRVPPGAGTFEFEFETTGKGQVIVKVTEMFPGGAEGAVKNYRFTVE